MTAHLPGDAKFNKLEKWHGSFWSDQYKLLGCSYVRGQVTASIPTQLPTQPVDKLIDITIAYGGLYKNGHVSTVKFDYRPPCDMAAWGSGMQPGITLSSKNPSGDNTGTFTIMQSINFVVDTINDGVIKGHYVTAFPNDSGLFELKKQ